MTLKISAVQFPQNLGRADGLLAAPSGTPTWLFDLDNTLYSSTAGLMEALSVRITQFIEERLGLPPIVADAVRDAYYGRYGSSVGGILRHCQVDVAEFLDFAHDLPVEQYLTPDGDLNWLLASLPGRKYLFTNAPATYANRVLHALGIEHHFDGIFDFRFGELEGKPAPAVYEKVMAALGHPAYDCWFVEDSVQNLMPAKALGCRTVWITQGNTEPPVYVDHRIRKLSELQDMYAISRNMVGYRR